MEISVSRKAVGVAAAIAASALIYFIIYAVSVSNKAPSFEKRVSGVFAKHGLDKKTLVKRDAEVRKKGIKRYISVFKEYNVPEAFSFSGFDKDLRRRLKWSSFKVASSDHVVTKRLEFAMYIIRCGKFDIFSLRLNKRRAPPLPTVIKRSKAPKVAIVMDDLGYNIDEMDEIFAIGEPITFAILPNLQFSKTIAKITASKGYETILHLPLESIRNDAEVESDTIKSTMGEKQILDMLNNEIESVPGLKGVSNHQGSKSTSEKGLMEILLRNLKRRDLYFFDSLTGNSVCGEVASGLGVKYARRDIFLDNSNKPDDIERQILEMRRLAFKRGKIIAICHYRKNTIKELAKMMPDLTAEGIKFVSLSEMVK